MRLAMPSNSRVIATDAPLPHRVRLFAGRFRNWRRAVSWPLLAFFFLTPWLSWNGEPAVFLDINQKEFHIFGWLLWPEDLLLLTPVMIGSAFALFFVSMYAGRLWCGYSCPQTVWTFLFIWLEEKIEGSRNKRRKLDQGKGSGLQKLRRGVKYLVWAALALATAITALSYFYPLAHWWADVKQGDFSAVATTWVVIIGSLTFLNAGWLRERVCTHMCPYSRFQSVMFDTQTYTVRYKAERGEPRGKKGADGEALGDCVDCGVCVQVCPTNIDIRDGLQIACIDCAACVDACDSIMETLNRPTGLIAYEPEEQLSAAQRWRLWGYGAAASVAFVLAMSLPMMSPDIDISSERDRQRMYQLTPSDTVENNYTVKVHNRKQEAVTVVIFDGEQSLGEMHLQPGARGSADIAIERDLDFADEQVSIRIQHGDQQAVEQLKFMNPYRRTLASN
jgi:cytochrome c oxidase accessory protein FixG